MKKHYFNFTIPLIFFFAILCTNANATDNEGRLGIGSSNQLINSLPALSFKLQKTRSLAFGALLGVDTDSDNGGWGAGVKLYRLLFEEPNLNFFAAILGALHNQNQGKSLDSKSGFQFDLTLGSEFHFSGLSSLGFSVEFGISFNKIDDFVIQTVGEHLVSAAVHFYL